MRIGAGITGILLGILSLAKVGLFGSMVGSAAEWLGTLGAGSSEIRNWGSAVATLSWAAPLLSIIGGIVTFSNPRVGGVLLAASAGLHGYLLGFGIIGKLFVLPIGAAAVLAFIAPSSNSTDTSWVDAPTAPDRPRVALDTATTAAPRFDRAKWNALIRYDTDIAAVAERIASLGQKWLDEFASSYLALNDKTYLPEIERKIVADAKADAGENEQRKILAEDQRKAFLQDQKRLAEARRKQIALWRDRLWGNRERKIVLLLTVLRMTGIAALFLPFVPDYSPVGTAFDKTLWKTAAPSFLSILASAASIRWIISGTFSPLERALAYVVSTATAGVTLSEIWPSQPWHWLHWASGVQQWLSTVIPIATIFFGCCLLIRNSRVRRLREFNPVMAIQVAYLAHALLCLIALFGSWEVGAYFVLVTAVVFLVQIILISAQRGRLLSTAKFCTRSCT